VEHERQGIVRVLDRMELQKHDGVVAGLNLPVNARVELCQAVGERYRAVAAQGHREAGKAVSGRTSQLACDGTMMISQDGHPQVGGAPQVTPGL
jgi:hypothetical protein